MISLIISDLYLFSDFYVNPINVYIYIFIFFAK